MRNPKATVEEDQDEPLDFFGAWMRNCRAYFITGVIVSLLVAGVVVGIAWFLATPTIAAVAGGLAFAGTFFWGCIETDPKRRL